MAESLYVAASKVVHGRLQLLFLSVVKQAICWRRMRDFRKREAAQEYYSSSVDFYIIYYEEERYKKATVMCSSEYSPGSGRKWHIIDTGTVDMQNT